jgi:hypothetical protein
MSLALLNSPTRFTQVSLESDSGEVACRSSNSVEQGTSNMVLLHLRAPRWRPLWITNHVCVPVSSLVCRKLFE